MSEPHVVILGAGPAGVGAAFQLARRGLARVTVLERNPCVGGNAGSFDLAGFRVDYGSHRLHPSCDPAILLDIRSLLGDDLLDRPRHGVLACAIDGSIFAHATGSRSQVATRFAIGVATDFITKVVPHRYRSRGAETFASILETGLGRTICREFYFPYARKIWGGAPEDLAVTQARRRVGASSLGKMLGKVLAAVPGLKPSGAGRFYYPRRGYGQISEAVHRAAEGAGAQFQFGATVQAVTALSGRVACHYEQNGGVQNGRGRSCLVDRARHHARPCAATRRARRDRRGRRQYRVSRHDPDLYRLGARPLSEYDAHYFPAGDISITRLSEPKNYSGSGRRSDRSVCRATVRSHGCGVAPQDGALADLVCAALDRDGIPVRVQSREVATRRLRRLPVYRQGSDVISTASTAIWPPQ